MKAPPLASIFVCGLIAIACGGRGGADASSTTTISSSQARERTVADRVATALCVREAECGRGDPVSCVAAAESRANRELAAWTCEPSQAKAAAEQCVNAILAEPCTTDLVSRPKLCVTNGGCASTEPIVPTPEPTDIGHR